MLFVLWPPCRASGSFHSGLRYSLGGHWSASLQRDHFRDRHIPSCVAETFVIACGVLKTSVLRTNVMYEYVYIASERQTEKRRVPKVLYVGCSSEHRPSLDTKFKCAGLSYQRTLRPSLPGGRVWLRAVRDLGLPWVLPPGSLSRCALPPSPQLSAGFDLILAVVNVTMEILSSATIWERELPQSVWGKSSLPHDQGCRGGRLLPGMNWILHSLAKVFCLAFPYSKTKALAGRVCVHFSRADLGDSGNWQSPHPVLPGNTLIQASWWE